jgi:hypothetical protein
MKRIELFEFEDLPWFPHLFRQCMTTYIRSLHQFLNMAEIIAPLVKRGLEKSVNQIVDLCSGAGGPMVEVVRTLRTDECSAPSLVLTDLYPSAAEDESSREHWLKYDPRPIDASDVPSDLHGMRTMICSLHHMSPDKAAKILRDACINRQPFLAFEISDNSSPTLLWWTAVPVGFLLTLVMTLRIRPVTIRQLFWTYLVPVLPLLIAWDGAVSNARTYSKDDLKELISTIDCPEYEWEIRIVKPRGLPIPMLYILGLPTKTQFIRGVETHMNQKAGTLDTVG